jgi:hypothetical protein
MMLDSIFSCFTQSAMPCLSNEEKCSVLIRPIQLSLRNDWARHDNLDAEREVTQSSDDTELSQKKKRRCIVASYTVVKCWVTGDRASEQSEEDSEID